MENKQYFENQYNLNFTSALNYAKQGNLEDALAAFKRSLEAAIKIMKITYGQEQANYKKRADQIVDSIKKIEAEMERRKKPVSGGPQQPPKGKPADPKEPKPPKEKIPVEQALAKLNELIGLGEVKKEVLSLTAELEMKMVREQSGLKGADTTHHLIFAGSPGTGKTTVARIMADILYSLGAIESGQLVEVGREDLVAGYVGQTGLKTQKAVEEAMGGVLFIDEVYRLGEGGENDFGKEAVGVLLKAVEDCRGEFVVILAGYENRMNDFFKLNPGLESRFPNRIHFTDYTPDEMYRIFEGMCKKNQYIISPAVEPMIKNKLNNMYQRRDENFGNARDVRNVYEKIIKKLNLRLYQIKKSGQQLSKEMLMTILPEDFE